MNPQKLRTKNYVIDGLQLNNLKAMLEEVKANGDVNTLQWWYLDNHNSVTEMIEELALIESE